MKIWTIMHRKSSKKFPVYRAGSRKGKMGSSRPPHHVMKKNSLDHFLLSRMQKKYWVSKSIYLA